MEVLTRKAGEEDGGWLWRYLRGRHVHHRGRIPRHLRHHSDASSQACRDEGDDDEGRRPWERTSGEDVADEWTIRRNCPQYSDFVAYPIRMEVRHFDKDGKEVGTKDEVAQLHESHLVPP